MRKYYINILKFDEKFIEWQEVLFHRPTIMSNLSHTHKHLAP